MKTKVNSEEPAEYNATITATKGRGAEHQATIDAALKILRDEHKEGSNVFFT